MIAIKRGFPGIPPPPCGIDEPETGPDPNDPDPEVGSEVEAVEPFWLVAL